MKIAMVCPASAHGIVGGAERLWEGVVDAINRGGEHTASVLAVRAPEGSLSEVLSSYQTFDRLDLSEFDAVITGKYPAWMVRHPRQIVHMCHTLRGLYDTYPSSLPMRAEPVTRQGRYLVELTRSLDVTDDWSRAAVLDAASSLLGSVPSDHPDLALPGPLARELVRWLDAHALHPTRISRYLAISETVAGRPGYFPDDVAVEVAVPPSGLQGLHAGPYRSIFTASRLDSPKRVDLLIDAMRHVTGPCELRIAGSGPEERNLRERAYHDERIVFLGRLSDEELVEEYANALVVPFVPLSEDLGLITLEAQMSCKPVVTCTDSGGVVDLVNHGSDGLIVAPNPQAIGSAIDRFVLDRSLSERMGAAGYRRARENTWERLVERLLAAPHQRVSDTAPRRRIVVFNTYAAEPARHGGQVRASRLMRQLGRRFDVHYVAITSASSGKSGQIAPGVWQSIIEPSAESRDLEARIAEAAAVPVGDVAALLSASLSQELCGIASNLIERSDAVVLSHPYLFPLARDLDRSVPIIYDSHNAEWSLKRAMYPHSPTGDALSAAVAEAEAATIRRAALVSVVSDDDAAQLQELASTMGDYVVVPNGVDVSTIPFVTGDERRSRRAAWLGSLDAHGWRFDGREVVLFMGSGHPPNIQAAHEVLRLASDLPDHMFVLVGSHVDELRLPFYAPNVLARGVVGDAELRLLLSICSVALNPMRSGSGTNIKMLDYFAAGAPTVSTEVGARGLGASHGRHLLLVSDRAGFADAITGLLADPTNADRLAAAARGLSESFDWEVIGERFAEHIDETLRQRLGG